MTDDGVQDDPVTVMIAGLLALVDELRDGEPCRYDSDEACQTHAGDRRPCPHERAADLLADAPARPGLGSVGDAG